MSHRVQRQPALADAHNGPALFVERSHCVKRERADVTGSLGHGFIDGFTAVGGRRAVDVHDVVATQRYTTQRPPRQSSEFTFNDFQ